MITPGDQAAYAALMAALVAFEADHGGLPGLVDDETRASLLEQVVASRRRKAYLAYVRNAELQEVSADPTSTLFDPMRAAVLHHRRGEVDEALWMLFLSTHLGRHRTWRWSYARLVYAGDGQPWTWDRLARDVVGFRDWLEIAQAQIRPQGAFGNHRKREHLSGWGLNGTGAVVGSYVDWIGEPPVHSNRLPVGGASPRPFGDLHASLAAVRRFGRLARFDYLSTGVHLGLLNSQVDRLYLAGSSGPKMGAKLLLGDPLLPVAQLEAQAMALGVALGISGDVLEDALCNWQKNPGAFRSFRG